MTDKEILKAVIEKAVKNGWNQNQDALNLFHIIENTVNDGEGVTIDKDYWILNVWLNYVIFDRDFAKALWGESEVGSSWWGEINSLLEKCLWANDFSGLCNFEGKRWQYHLQRLALEDNRIEYLKQFIDEN